MGGVKEEKVLTQTQQELTVPSEKKPQYTRSGKTSKYYRHLKQTDLKTWTIIIMEHTSHSWYFLVQDNDTILLKGCKIP